ncbi:hypothetical protein ZIOFF_009506 [Zingiber officinale]|uniref:TRF2/HOY1 PH-like domain-containing protein n=1 Tax=Zingiber officinale TaxID=94328 RepID=A0A8J5HXY5_ZINOF|nr:hypothetical protein ZIOFF_009506 [Zingiber officinale]
MVWSSDSGKRRADSTQHSASPPPVMKLEVEEPFDEKRVCLHKRARDASTSLEQDLYNNMLGETGPLDLRPRKSGHGTLDIVLARPPLFFRAANPQPRKHTPRTLDFDSQDTPSPCSVEELASRNTSLSCDALFDKEIIDFIPQFFDNDSQSFAASDEQSIIPRGNSLYCLLQQNTVGGMDWSSNSDKRRADSTQHLAPPPPAVKLEVEEPLDEKRVHLHKRARDASTSCEQTLYNNVLGKPGPLGKTLCFTSSNGSEVGEQSDFSTSSSSLSKIKASNFPASLLRIGIWEHVSRYEGDLVAKCYFAKHKLIWEVLEGGHGTLDIVLARPSLFFRAADPQPRKHTPKNFEKLIDYDSHLKQLSQQPDIILESPYFNLQYSVLKDQSDFKSHINDFIKDDSRTTISGFYEPGPPCATSSISNKTETRDSFERTLDFDSQDTPSPCSVEELASGNTSLSCDALFDKEITDFIPQFFDNDSQSFAASDEQSIISRGNSLCCLL